MSAHIAPVSVWCPVDEFGVLQPQHCQFYRHEILTPAGANWRMVRVIVEPMEAYDAQQEAVRAIDDLPDCVAAAVMMGGQRDEWAEDEVS